MELAFELPNAVLAGRVLKCLIQNAYIVVKTLVEEIWNFGGPRVEQYGSDKGVCVVLGNAY